MEQEKHDNKVGIFFLIGDHMFGIIKKREHMYVF